MKGEEWRKRMERNPTSMKQRGTSIEISVSKYLWDIVREALLEAEVQRGNG